MKRNTKTIHNKFAPYWAVALLIFGITGVLTINFNLGRFWNGYVLDMMGPAWNYILFRGLYTIKADNVWTRFFTPVRTFVIFVSVCFGIELLQYLKLYEATFDPWDLVAYISILFPLFLLDLRQKKVECMA